MNKEKMSSELKKRLENLQGWSWGLYDDIHWFEYYALLKEFFALNKTLKISWVYMTPDGYPLGKWADMQRKNKAKLTLEKVGLLDALPNWRWVEPDASQ